MGHIALSLSPRTRAKQVKIYCLPIGNTHGRRQIHVRGFHLFQSITPTVPNGNPWQDWIVSDDTDTSGSFKHESGDENGPQSASGTPAPQFRPMTPSAGGATPGGRVVALNAGVIEEDFAATRASAS